MVHEQNHEDTDEMDNSTQPCATSSTANAIELRFLSNHQTLMDAAMSNVVILDRIFCCLSSIQTLRLVCKSWNDFILNGRPRLRLQINCIREKGEDSDNEDSYDEDKVWRKFATDFPRLLDTLDSRLAKSTYVGLPNVGYSNQAIGGLYNLRLDDNVLIHFFEKLGSNIQQLSVIWSIEIIPTLYQIFGGDGGTQLCPTLTTVFLDITDDPVPQSFIIPPVTLQNKTFPFLSKLQSITMRCSFKDDSKSRFTSTLLQDLLLTAPKLVELDLKSISFPTLEFNKALTSLRYNYAFHEGFNSRELTNFLREVKNSLEKLEIVSSSFDGHCCHSRCEHPTLHLQLPEMPKLRTLGITNTQFFGIHLNPRQLGRDRMPALKTLRLSNTEFPWNRSGVVQKIWDEILIQDGLSKKCPGSSVTRLKLIGFDPSDMVDISGLRKCIFPNLEILDLRLPIEKGEVMGGNQSIRVGAAIYFSSFLGLKHLRIDTGMTYGVSALVESLWRGRKDLFSGSLQTLEIINFFQSWRRIQDVVLTTDGAERFEEILSLTKGMESVVFGGFLLMADHAKKVFKYIASHNLPVDFK